MIKKKANAQSRVMDDKPVPQLCAICFMPFDGFGNNASPVNEGKCCDRCNLSIVVPARITIGERSIKQRRTT